MLTLVASALGGGGDCIDDSGALRAGRTSSVLGCMVKAPSTLGTFLRSFRWGHVRQLDRVSRELLARAWAAGAGPGNRAADHPPGLHHLRDLRAGQGGGATPWLHWQARLSPAAGRGRRNRRRADVSAARGPVQHRPRRRPLPGGRRWAACVMPGPGVNSRCGPAAASTPIPSSPSAARWVSASPSPIRQRASLRNLIEAIPEADWTPIPYWMDGAADVAETAYTPFRSKPDAAPVRLIVRRVKPTPGSQLALFASYSYHGFITDRDGDTLELEAGHLRHAEVENAIRDLKYGVGLNHLPSGRFAANAAWLAVQALAHNLTHWAARIGLGEQLVTTKTLRRRFFSMAGRLTRSARRLTLHLPQGWPWAEQATLALARLRAIPLPA